MSNTCENIISYESDSEYRDCLRKFCNMVCIDRFQNDPTIDRISRDENLFDEQAMSSHMNHLYDKTMNSPAFRVLYELAAGRMFSLDPEIGLCVLMSYDYFRDFYIVYHLFLTVGEGIENETPYSILKNKLS